MQRICEPELMDDDLQAQAYAAADFSAGDQAVLERIAQLFDQRLGEQLLDLGCGPGNISFRLAERCPSAQVVAVDGAAAMVQLGRERQAADPERWPRLTFVQAVLAAEGLPGAATQFTPAGFTAVVSNSLLHHLHDPQALWRGLRTLAAPGAAIYVKDLRRPPSPEAVQELRKRYVAGAPAVLQHDYVASLHAAFTLAEVEQQLQAAGLAAALQVAACDDRYLEVWGRMP